MFTGGALADALDTLVLSATGVGWLVAEHPPEPQIGRSEPYCTTTLFSGSTITSGF